MSIFGALRSGVSGLFVQSQALATTSDNIANVNTNGYKVNRVQFSTLVTTSASPTLYSSGGVQSRVARDINEQGLLAASSSATDLAITGQGFFTVTDELTLNATTGEQEVTGDIFYTRAGEFRTDQDGNLVNAAGFFLTGWGRNATDTGFEVTNVANAFSGVNVSAASAVATPTTSIELEANLRASTATGNTFDIGVQVFNRQGAQRTLTVTFTKDSAPDTWDVSATIAGGGQFINPDADGNSAAAIDNGAGADTAGDLIIGADEQLAATQLANLAAGDMALDGVSANLGQVTFNPDGSLATVTSNLPTPGTDVALDGADTLQFLIDYDADATTAGDLVAIDLNLGSLNSTNGLKQFEGANVIDDIDQNGRQFGSLTGVTVSEDGIVTALFDNGVTREIFQIPVTTFNSPNALQPRTGNVFSQTDDSGQAVARVPGTGGSGVISPSSLEQSTVDIADEFTKLIVTQRSYSANTRSITTADELLEELIRIVR
ncbi:MAG: flagellar hook protein FlgE [Alphaproteobacteria bacterium]|nr:flagellar hook protein FlgE [Alphaproteobacteria bacterium]